MSKDNNIWRHSAQFSLLDHAMWVGLPPPPVRIIGPIVVLVRHSHRIHSVSCKAGILTDRPVVVDQTIGVAQPAIEDDQSCASFCSQR